MPRRTKSQLAEDQQVIADQMKGLPDKFLDCRDPGLRHQWHKTKDFHVIPTESLGRRFANIQREETCLRCGTIKIEKFAMFESGISKLGQHYEYPEGYLFSNTNLPRGVKRSSLVWGENFRRAGITAAGILEENGEPPSKANEKKTRKKGDVTPIRRKAG